MAPRQSPFSFIKLVAHTGLSLAVLWSTAHAKERRLGGPGVSASAPPAASATGSGATPTTAPAVPGAQDRLQRTNSTLAAVKKMQMDAYTTARDAAFAAAASRLKVDLPVVPKNSWNVTNGLKPLTGATWTGAAIPDLPAGSSDVTITQTQQQALLHWETFNIGAGTTLTFDQSAGGTNAGQWIAFNKIGVTGSPSQILGKINAQGQVYVINPNGIIFGGSSQVNAHALVASALPINDNLIQRGVLNNPDAQFLFSALSQDAGKNGTPAFVPTVIDEFLPPADTSATHKLAWKTTTGSNPSISFVSASATAVPLIAGDDYMVSAPGTDGRMTVAFTTAGLQKKPSGTSIVQVAYTPTGDQYGNVEVQAGALLKAPTNADHVGGRVALIGANVSNAGTISTEDGQAILAAGLQVAFAPHNAADPTLRGLDVFVGAVADPALNVTNDDGTVTNTGKPVGTVTNDLIFNSDKTVAAEGLIEAPRGAVTLTGKTVNQLGFIESSTSVAYNGRVDLVAGYNAVANSKYNPGLSAAADFTLALPFFYQSHENNDIARPAVSNSGRVTLGRESVLRILPEASGTDRVAGDLALPSQVNIQGESVHFEPSAILLAPGAAVPLAKAVGADGRALEAGVSIRAGAWFNPGSTAYNFVHSSDVQQIYLDQGAVVDVAGSAAVKAAVTENIVSVELRGSELANSPLQRDGPLRGQTVQVDLRKHGPWDQTLNGGLGGYSWVGTPLADTAGWVGLTTHSVGELTVNGGSVAFKAGGAVVLQAGSTIDVSGGSIDYQAGYTQTTKVFADGHIYDISQASPDRLYDAIYAGTTTTTDPKWGVTTTTRNPLAQSTSETGYSQGGSGGSVAITAPVLALDGTLRGTTMAGPTQRTFSPLYNPASPPDPAHPAAVAVPAWLLNTLSRPLPGQFSLTVGRQYVDATNSYANYSPTPANIVFRPDSALALAEAYKPLGNYLFPALRKYELDLSPELFTAEGGGFGVVRVNNQDDNIGGSPAGFGNITVKAGTALAFAPGSSVNLSAGNITVENGASLTASGGLISLKAYDISPSRGERIDYLVRQKDPLNPVSPPLYNPIRGNISIGTGALLSAAGGLIDDRNTAPTAGTLPLLTTGGSIELEASDLILKTGSTLDVSGGGQISATGKLTYADAGRISLTAGKALGNGFGALLGGRLNLTGATLRGYAGAGKKGGSLSLQAPAILIKDRVDGATAVTDTTTGKLFLAPEFFNQGGFASFSATGLGVALGVDGKMTGTAPALTVAANTRVKPTVLNWATYPGGEIFLLPESLRKGASLNFKTAGLFSDVNKMDLFNDLSLAVEAGAVLDPGAGGSVALGGGTVDFLGTATARGGAITITQSGGAALYVPGIHLGKASVLDASGTTVYGLDFTGEIKPVDVLDGGTIVVSGNLVAEKGASLDVSGATNTIFVIPGQPSDGLPTAGGGSLVSSLKDSNGGKLTIEGNQVLFSAATLQGAAGGTTARAGDLVVVSKRSLTSLDGGDLNPGPLDPVLTLTASTPEFVYAGLGQAVKNTAGVAFRDTQGLGQIWFGADSFTAGRFGALDLSVGRGALQVQGNVALSANRQITIADGGVLSFIPDPKVPLFNAGLSLGAPYVKIGSPFLPPLASGELANPLGQNISATHGAGLLTVHASKLIDVGTLSLQNFGSVTLDATYAPPPLIQLPGSIQINSSANWSSITNGSIRGNGTLDVAGEIILKAGQIYPPTATTFNVIANDYTEVDALKPTLGRVVVVPSGISTSPSLPLSAGGNLNLYASLIEQGGSLRAPLGQIRLGADDASALNVVSGKSLPPATRLTVQPGSVTSVSALDPVTGKPVAIPFGINVNGDTWIAPTGTDITSVGSLAKSITLTAKAINFQGATPATATTPAVAAASIDLSGGGDLSAYQFVPGVGGKTDILLGSTAGVFAIVPGYADVFAPEAAYNTTTEAQISLGKDPGYLIGNTKLGYAVGDRIHLAGGGGLLAGDYTLLPARYALVPGAYLVTPRTDATTNGATTSLKKPDGSLVMSGYRFKGFDAAGQTQSLFRSFEVAPQAVVLKRAEYKQYSANQFFADVAASNDTVAPRLPVDAGRLGLTVDTELLLKGNVLTQAATGGRGGLIDLSSSADIVIGSKAVITQLEAAKTKNTLLLEAKQLSGFGADSLLIGGVRTTDDKGTTVTVKTNKITVDNAGEALTGSDVILAANQSLTLKDGAEIGKTGQPLVAADPLLVTGTAALNAIGENITFTRGGLPISLPNGTPGAGKLTSTSAGTITRADGTTTRFLATTTGLANAFTVPAGATITLDQAGQLAFAVSTDTIVKSIALTLGDGTLIRVGSDPNASITRTGIASSAKPVLSLGAGAKIIGAGAILDSSNTTNLNEKVDLGAVDALSLNSGRISILLDQPGTVSTTGSLVLSRAAQTSLLKNASAVSLLSYSTLDLYGTGTFGSSTLGSLALHAGTIRSYPNSVADAGVILAAKSLTLDNVANAPATPLPVSLPIPPGTVSVTGVLSPAVSLALNTENLHLGGNQVEIQNFTSVAMNASGGVLTGDTAKLGVKNGGLRVVGGDLTIKTPLLTSAKTTDHAIVADGKLILAASAGTATVTPGLGARLSLTGESVDIGTVVRLPSGTLSVKATTGDLAVTGGTLDVGGTAQQFYEVTRYTDGGRIALSADAGKMMIAAGSKISVSALAGGGSAGALEVFVPTGSFSIADDTLFGNAAAGFGGNFSLDTQGIGTDPKASYLKTLSEALADGGFDRTVAVRVRQGDVVADGTLRAHEIALAADQGKITVTGTMDASGLSLLDPKKPATDPTGGKIDLTASGSVVLSPTAGLNATGFAYNNAGKGGAISLSAGSYRNGVVDSTAKVDIQSGARIDLDVRHRFTPNDQLLNPGVALPLSNRTDLFTGTLHVRESQTAFGDGTQFSSIGNAVRNASSIGLEGYQVFDLTSTGGLIDSAVEKAVKDNGAAFLGAVSPALVGNALIHVQPGAEIVNNATVSATVTRNFVAMNSSDAATRSVVNFNLTPGNGVFTSVQIPGGLPLGVGLKTQTGRRFTLTTADGVTSAVITATNTTTIASASADNPVVAVNFQNTGATALSTQLNFSAGFTPVTLALDPATTITTSSFAGRYSSLAGDLTLANTWDLSSNRFGPRLEPGNLTLRAKGNLVLGFDASLSDGFDPTKYGDGRYPLWTALLMSDPSTSYRLVAGADYRAADSRSVQSLGALGTSAGSILLGQGSLPLPTATGSTVTRASIIPQYFQTIRTGTGNIELAAGRDVQFLNPLATIYTAGRTAAALENFDVPVLDADKDSAPGPKPYYPAQYSWQGGDVTIRAQNDIARYVLSGTRSTPGANLVANSSKEMPTNWLYRRGNVGPDGKFLGFTGTVDEPIPPTTEIQSTTWWIDYSNFFADTGALGGGNVALTAGRNVSNVNAAAPTTARMPGLDAAGKPVVPDAAGLVEFGGGNVSVQAGADIDGGVYYVERGDASVRAGGAVKTNATRAAFNTGSTVNPATWLPTTFFLGKGRVNVAASGDLRLGPVVNAFWQPQGVGNRLYETSYFSTYDSHNEVNAASLGGSITVQVRPDTTSAASLIAWYTNMMSTLPAATAAAQPWLRLGPQSAGGGTPYIFFQTVTSVLPATYRAAAYAGDINLVGRLTLAPSPTGTLDLLAAGNINGLQVNGISTQTQQWGTAVINLSDADPARLPSITKPLSSSRYSTLTSSRLFFPIDSLFAESGRSNFSLEEKLALHGQTTDASGKPVLLHANDTEPLRLYAVGGDLSGLTLYSAKTSRVIAGNDLTDVALYVQNVRPADNTLVAAGHDLIAYNPASALRIAALKPGNLLAGAAGETGPGAGTPVAGDIQIAGPGTLQVLAGRNLDLGSGSNATKDDTAVGITSVGAARNPYLPQNAGAGIVAAAGVGSVYTPAASALGQIPSLATTSLKLAGFIGKFIDPNAAGTLAPLYLPVLGKLMDLTTTDATAIWQAFALKPEAERAMWALRLFNTVLRNSARDRNDPAKPTFGTYADGFAAIEALFPASPLPTKADIESKDPVVRPAGPWEGHLSLSTRLIKTSEGGDIMMLVPGGEITVGRATDPQKPDQGVLTARGGAISIFAADSVNVGTSRIFTLRGGNEILWSTWGNIAAGSGSKTVFSAPPTRVLIDPQSGDVQNDLAGLATGSGIGVLATLSGVKPGDVDLIAPVGTIDAGDAGIRSSGNLNIAARVVLNAGNIQVGGTSAGTPPPPPAPNLGSLTAASTASTGASNAATDVAKQNTTSSQMTELPSLITVEVLGYGGGDDEDEEERKKKIQADADAKAQGIPTP